MSSASNSSQTDIPKIREWLAHIFGDEEVPPFEETEESIKALKQIMARNLEAEKNTCEIIKQEEKLSEIYNKKSEKLASLLDCEVLSLNPKTSEAINCLASLAKDMNLKEPTFSNFLLAIFEAETKVIESEKENKTIEYHLSSLNRKLTSIIEKNEILKRDLKNLKDTVKIQQSRDPSIAAHISYFKKKEEEYKFRIKKYEKHLENVGCKPDLYHHNLVEQSEKIQKMEEQVKSLAAHLEVYESLPPNETLASLKVQETRQEMQALEEKFNKLLESNAET